MCYNKRKILIFFNEENGGKMKIIFLDIDGVL